jgi:MYXO-CTERM domain-containing protein
MLRRLGFWSSSLASLWLAVACGSDPGPVSSSKSTRAPESETVTEFAPVRGSFAWPSAGRSAHSAATAVEAARRYAADLVAGNARGARRASLGASAVHDTGRGPLVVRLEQRFDGVEVYRGDLRVLLRRDRSLVTIAGKVAVLPETAAFVSSPEQALARAFREMVGTALVGPLRATEQRGDYVHFDLAASLDGGGAPADFEANAPARVKRVLFESSGALRPAYYVEILGARPSDARPFAEALVIADADGRVLERRSLVSHASFDYRVYAKSSADRRPLAAPSEDFVPHPSGLPNGLLPGPVAPTLVRVEGLNQNPEGAPDPWLPADATQTQGNHVDAYVDAVAPDGFNSGDLRATLTGPGAFDRVFDQTISPTANESQKMASVTQAFYVTNWLHDWYYDSGFDEDAGNAQHDNYGRGGQSGDRMLVELQDFGNTDNANMVTPADGASPRMQMYLYSPIEQRELVVGATGERLPNALADFSIPTFDVTQTLVLAQDGAAPAGDACQAITNDVAGKVVLVDRGLCDFQQKAGNVQAAGGVAMVLANSVAGTVPPPMGVGSGPTITIPVMSITLDEGNELKAALQSAAVQLTLKRSLGPNLDSALDFGIVAHEYGHYVFGRLGVVCDNGQCAAINEGWGDFIALHALFEAGDAPSAAFPLSTHASLGHSDSYFGTRRAPYSTDPSKNAFSFRHIADGEPLPSHPLDLAYPVNSEAHNAGEIFASMMFEAYAKLLAAHPYEEARRRMSDYVVAGMALTPDDPTYLEQRDAILAGAAASDPADAVLVAQGFAIRGAGSCAVAPERYSGAFGGITESFELAPVVSDFQLEISEGDPSCDDDGLLDVKESGKVSVSIANVGPVPLAGAKLALSSENAEVEFEDDSVAIPEIAPFSTGKVEVEVALLPGFEGHELSIDAVVDSDDACATDVATATVMVNVDESEKASKLDTVEALETAWEVTGAYSPSPWSRALIEPSDRAWIGFGPSSLSDTQLVSPELEVSDTAPFVISFSHRHDFEQEQTLNYDAGVIEIRANGGAWTDVATYATMGYGGVVQSDSDNPLGGRMAYVGRNPAWPSEDSVTLDLGTAFAGQTVRVRFRLCTDQAVQAGGWQIDDIAFDGIDNLPFTSVLAEDGVCSPANGGAGAPGAGGAPSEPGGDQGGESGEPSTSGESGGKGGTLQGNAGGDDEPKSAPRKRDDGGCGCRAVGPDSTPELAWLPVVALGLALARRRRLPGPPLRSSG